MRDFFWKLRMLWLHLLNAYGEWYEYIWQHDPDERWCCDGRECGCEAMTIRETWTPSERGSE